MISPYFQVPVHSSPALKKIACLSHVRLWVNWVVYGYCGLLEYWSWVWLMSLPCPLLLLLVLYVGGWHAEPVVSAGGCRRLRILTWLRPLLHLLLLLLLTRKWHVGKRSDKQTIKIPNYFLKIFLGLNIGIDEVTCEPKLTCLVLMCIVHDFQTKLSQKKWINSHIF